MRFGLAEGLTAGHGDGTCIKSDTLLLQLTAS
jgi:hypothetical protein